MQNKFLSLIAGALLISITFSCANLPRVEAIEKEFFYLPPGTRIKFKNEIDREKGKGATQVKGAYYINKSSRTVKFSPAKIIQGNLATAAIDPNSPNGTYMATLSVLSLNEGKDALLRFEIDFDEFTNDDITFDRENFKEVIDEIRLILNDWEIGGFDKVSNSIQNNDYKKVAFRGPKIDQGKSDINLSAGQQQDIIDQIFENIAHPIDLSLYRYMYIQNIGYTFILLNPKVDVEVSLPVFQRATTGPAVSSYSPAGRQIYDIVEAEDGSLKFDLFNQTLRFPGFQNELKNYSGNIPVSLADAPIDLDINKHFINRKYVVLFQPANIVGLTNKSGVSGAETEFGTYLLFTRDFRNITKDPQLYKNLPSAVFGLRSIAWPVIRIVENGQLRYLPLGTGSNYYRNEIGNMKHFFLQRLYKGRYRNLKLGNHTIPLLPGDKITF